MPHWNVIRDLCLVIGAIGGPRRLAGENGPPIEPLTKRERARGLQWRQRLIPPDPQVSDRADSKTRRGAGPPMERIPKRLRAVELQSRQSPSGSAPRPFMGDKRKASLGCHPPGEADTKRPYKSALKGLQNSSIPATWPARAHAPLRAPPRPRTNPVARPHNMGLGAPAGKHKALKYAPSPFS